MEVVSLVSAQDLGRSTPCAAWTLRELLAHMTAQHDGFAAAARGGSSLAPWRPRPGESDPVGAYRRAAEHVLAAFAEENVLQRSFLLPEIDSERPFPGARAVGFHLVDYVVHTWDVAKSLEVPVDFSSPLLDAASAVARAVPDGPTRTAPGGAFAPRLSDSRETALDEIVALLGRSPTWPKGSTGVFWPLRTDRLHLRPFTSDDIDAMYAYQGLSEVARYLYRPPRTRQECADVIAKSSTAPSWVHDGDSVTLAVCRSTTQQIIGEIVLKLADAHARQVEIGWIIHPDHAGQGYATEAARAAAAAAFGPLGAHRLFARLDTRNSASVRLCERLGMRREAHLVENDLDRTGWGSEYVYAALPHELA